FVVAEQARDRRPEIAEREIRQEIQAVSAFPVGIAVELAVAQRRQFRDAGLVGIFDKKHNDLVRPDRSVLKTQIQKVAIVADMEPAEVRALTGPRGNGTA